MDFKLATRELGRTINRNSPSILTGLGIAGFATSIVMAVSATPKAMDILAAEEIYRHTEIKDPDYNIDITPQEKVMLTWQCYAPTVGLALLSATSIIMANRINLRRNAALASLYAIAESGLRDYQKKVVETIGNKKEEKIRGEVAQQNIDRNPAVDSQIINTGRGTMLSYETLSGRYFFSDPEALRQAMNSFNERLNSEMELPINELYYEMGLSSTELGARAGWKADDGLPLFDFSSRLETKTNQLCLVIGYTKQPKALWF